MTGLLKVQIWTHRARLGYSGQTCKESFQLTHEPQWTPSCAKPGMEQYFKGRNRRNNQFYVPVMHWSHKLKRWTNLISGVVFTFSPISLDSKIWKYPWTFVTIDCTKCCTINPYLNVCITISCTFLFKNLYSTKVIGRFFLVPHIKIKGYSLSNEPFLLVGF